MLCIDLLTFASSARAQDAPADSKNILELPEFVITGSGTLGIQSVHKLDVTGTWKLDSASRALLRPVVGVVRGARTLDSTPAARSWGGFPLIAHGEYGVYSTPSGWLHYAGADGAFDWLAHAAGESTRGSVEHGAASHVSFGAAAGWRVPDNVMTFANARVGVDVAVDDRKYNLVGSSSPTVERTVDARDIRIALVQDEGTAPFSLMIGNESAEAKDSVNRSESQFVIDGRIALTAAHWTVRAGALLHSVSAASLPRSFSQIDFDAEYRAAPFRYSAGAALYASHTTPFGSTTELGPHVTAALAIGGAELYGSLSRHLREESLASLARANPFFAIASVDSIRYPLDEMDVRVGARTTESRVLVADGRLAYFRTAFAPVFVPDGSGSWIARFQRSSTLEFSGEWRWNVVERTAIIAAGAARIVTLAETHHAAPFVPPVEATVTAMQSFDSPFDCSLSLSVVGRRTTTLDGSGALPAMALLGAEAHYTLSKNVMLTMQGRNLLNANDAAWPGYPATRVFVAAGVTARL